MVHQIDEKKTPIIQATIVTSEKKHRLHSLMFHSDVGLVLKKLKCFVNVANELYLDGDVNSLAVSMNGLAPLYLKYNVWEIITIYCATNGLIIQSYYSMFPIGSSNAWKCNSRSLWQMYRYLLPYCRLDQSSDDRRYNELSKTDFRSSQCIKWA